MDKNTKVSDGVNVHKKMGLEENDPVKLRQHIAWLNQELELAHRRGVTPLRIAPAKVSRTSHLRFNVGGHKGSIQVTIFDDGQPGEVKISVLDNRPIVHDLIDSLGIMLSLALQYGVPTEVIFKVFARRGPNSGIVEHLFKRLEHEVKIISDSRIESLPAKPR